MSEEESQKKQGISENAKGLRPMEHQQFPEDYQAPPIKTMEAHKHAHGAAHKKSVGEYLMEFFMLFLAVFLGFVAENLREGLVDRRKEKAYIISLIQDLKKDTAVIKYLLPANEKQQAGLDSLSVYLSHPPYPDSFVKVIYRLHRKFGSVAYPVSFTRKTINQLQNAGGMQLIRNQKASDGIVYYYDWVATADAQMNAFRDQFLVPIINNGYSIFDDTYPGLKKDSSLSEVAEKLRLLTSDQLILKSYANRLRVASGVIGKYIMMLNTAEKSAIELAHLLHSEYHLENE